MRPLNCALIVTLLAVSNLRGVDMEMQQIDQSLTVGYAVRLIDMNQDGRLDIVVLDSTRLIWFENPSWNLRTIITGKTKPDNVCFAPHDIDGDGKLDFAIGADWRPMDTKTGGTLEWIRQGGSLEDWTVYPIGEEPTVHRMQWADLDGNGKKTLVVVPLMGRNSTKPNWQETPVRILGYSIPADPTRDRWKLDVLDESTHVTHNFQIGDLDDNQRTDILLASFEGVSWLDRASAGDKWRWWLLGTGNQQTSPNRGSSEIKRGKLANGQSYIATVEPWHGFQIVVYTPPAKAGELWQRFVIDDDLLWGHAVWCANLDADADEELVIGIRDDKNASAKSGLRIYDPAGASPATWKAQRFDAGGVAIEDLAVGDLDGDGKQDVAAVGRKSKNVRIYWNRTQP